MLPLKFDQTQKTTRVRTFCDHFNITTKPTKPHTRLRPRSGAQGKRPFSASPPTRPRWSPQGTRTARCTWARRPRARGSNVELPKREEAEMGGQKRHPMARSSRFERLEEVGTRTFFSFAYFGGNRISRPKKKRAKMLAPSWGTWLGVGQKRHMG